MLAGLIFVLMVLELVVPARSQGLIMLPAVLAAVFIVLPVCAFLAWRHDAPWALLLQVAIAGFLGISSDRKSVV